MRWWQRVLLLALTVYAMLWSVVLLPPVEEPGRDIVLYVFGYFFGVVLMFSGLIGEEDRAMRKKLSSQP